MLAFKSIYINALLLTLLIYRIEIYLMLSSWIWWLIWENLWKQLPTFFANLRTLVARGPLLGIQRSLLSPGSHLFLVLIANLLCQPENFSCPGTVAWDTKIPPLSGKPSLPCSYCQHSISNLRTCVAQGPLLGK